MIIDLLLSFTLQGFMGEDLGFAFPGTFDIYELPSAVLIQPASSPSPKKCPEELGSSGHVDFKAV